MPMESSEFPNLYQLELVLYDTNNEIIESIQEQVGFRKFTLRIWHYETQRKTNLYSTVINRHEWDPKNRKMFISRSNGRRHPHVKITKHQRHKEHPTIQTTAIGINYATNTEIYVIDRNEI